MTSPLHTAMPLSAAEPSFFEIFMADRLDRALGPAFKHMVQSCAAVTAASGEEQDRLSGLSRLGHWFLNIAIEHMDEAELLILGTLQARSIWKHDALLAERIYGLRRCFLPPPKPPGDGGGWGSNGRVRSDSDGGGVQDSVSAAAAALPLAATDAVKPAVCVAARGSSSSTCPPSTLTAAGSEGSRPPLPRPVDALPLDSASGLDGASALHMRRQRQRQQGVAKTVAWFVLLPYLKRKLDAAYRRGVERSAYLAADPEEVEEGARDARGAGLRLLLWAFPLLHACYEGGALAAQLAFLCGLAGPGHFHAAQWPWRLRVRLPRLPRAMSWADGPAPGSGRGLPGGSRAAVLTLGLDQVYVRTRSETSATPVLPGAAPHAAPASSSYSSSSSSSSSVAGVTPSARRRPVGWRTATVAAVVISYKALEWWRRSGRAAAAAEAAQQAVRRQRARAQAATATAAAGSEDTGGGRGGGDGGGGGADENDGLLGCLPVPPPPPAPPRHKDGVALPLDRKRCPLCFAPRVAHPAACTASGVVACYRCLTGYVAEFGRCPVTHRPCNATSIRRLYDDSGGAEEGGPGGE